MPKIYTFSVPGISCNSCTESIENALQKQKIVRIKHISFDVTQIPKKLKIEVENENLTPQEIQKIKDCVTEAGFDCEYEIETDKKNNQTQTHIVNYLIKGIVGLLCGITLLAISTFATLPLIAIYCIAGITTLLALYLGAETYFQAVKKFLKTQALTMETLFTISTLVALVVSIAALFVVGLPMLFSTPLLIFGFRYIGKAIEASAKEKVMTGLYFRERVPTNVTVLENGESSSRAISTIKPGEIIIVNPGEIISLNGLCTEISTIYDTIESGSTLPKTVQKDTPLLAGMYAAEKPITIQVTADEKASYIAKVDADLQTACSEKAPIETTANSILRYFIPIVLVLAIISAICIGIFFTPALAIQCFVAVLVSACPCTLGSIVPLSVQIGISKARDYGVQFKSGKSLQIAEQIDTVVFDLNGTLTNGRPEVRELHVCEEYSSQQVLSYFHTLEKKSKHPIAQAVCDYAKGVATLDATNIVYKDHGIQGVINGELYTVGDQTMMREQGIDTKNFFSNTGQHIDFLARGKEIISYIVLHDSLRNDAKTVIDGLRKMGKEIYICTCLSSEKACFYAKALDIDDEHLATNRVGTKGDNTKLSYIKMLQDKGHKVAMVGDAGNDAVPVSASDLGVAVKSPYGESHDEIVTQNRADVRIKNTSLISILEMFSIADKSVTNIRQNLIASVTYNSVILVIASGLLIAVGFTLNPGIGVALMILQMSLVLLNAYRFKCSAPHPELKNITNTITEKNKVGVDAEKNLFYFQKTISASDHYDNAFYPAEQEQKQENYNHLKLNTLSQ